MKSKDPNLQRLLPEGCVMIRANVSPFNKAVCIDKFYDILEADTKLKEYYNDVSKLPEEVSSNLYTLSTLEVGTKVEGLGWRPAENTYWIVVDKNAISK